MKHRFVIEIETSETSTKRVKDHIRTASKRWGGSFDPGHNMHPQNISVSVSRLSDVEEEFLEATRHA